jgi:hypothetical protein
VLSLLMAYNGGVFKRLFRRHSESEMVAQIGKMTADAFREGFENPPQTEEEQVELYRRLFIEGKRFPTHEEITDHLFEEIRRSQ